MRHTFTTILCVFLAGLFMEVKSQTEHSIGSNTMSESERCVCPQPHVTIKPPVCGRSVPVNSGTGCNSTTIQEILHTISTIQEQVSSELEDTRRKNDELQATVSSQLEDSRRKMDELLESVSTLITLLQSKDCSDIRAKGVTRSGVYVVKPFNYGDSIRVYCDMRTDGGGWTVFQRRQDGSVDFYLDFANYSRGFGDLEGEFWLGNDNLHRLTAQGEYELRVDLSDFENNTAYAVYDSVSIADVSNNYTLVVGAYSGTAGDALAYHSNQAFTTKDRDNDLERYDHFYYYHDNGNCAQRHHGAWWYKYCYTANLNGMYYNDSRSYVAGIRWSGFSGYRSLQTTQMKIRRKN